MRKVLLRVTLFSLAMLFLSTGCSKRMCYVNVFGDYSLSDARAQYEELFQMKPSEYNQFLSFKDGWWLVDVKKMRAMGIDIPTLCERYCRMENIKVPFPIMVDYDLLRGNAQTG